MTFQQLHHDEVTAVLLADFVDYADVRVIERRGGAGFALETLVGIGSVVRSLGKEFECDAAAEGQIFGLVDHSHSANAKLRKDLVVRKSLADQG